MGVLESEGHAATAAVAVEGQLSPAHPAYPALLAVVDLLTTPLIIPELAHLAVVAGKELLALLASHRSTLDVLAPYALDFLSCKSVELMRFFTSGSFMYF